MRICDWAVTYVSDKIVYVAVQMKDGAIYVGTAALVGVTAASDAVGDWVSEFVGSAVGSETALLGKPGEVVRVDTPPPLPSEKETFGSEIPSWPGDAVGPIAVPGQENNGPSGGTTTTTPLPEEQGPGLIFNEGEGYTGPAGEAARLIGQEREAAVASMVDGSVSGEKVAILGLGSTDIDVVASNGNLVAVGGPAKASNLGKLGQELRIYKAIA
jgi:hypothetical protein